MLSHELTLLSVFMNSAWEKGACPELISVIKAFGNLSNVLRLRAFPAMGSEAAVVHVSAKLEA